MALKQKPTIDEMRKAAKRVMMSFMPKSIECIFEHVLDCTSFDEATTFEEMAIAHNCLGIGLLHGLYTGLSQVLEVEDRADLERKMEVFDMLRDDVSDALHAIAKDNRDIVKKVIETIAKRDGK